MDIVDKVSYDFEWDNEEDLIEATRIAYHEVFDIENKNCQLVMRHICNLCKWNDMSEFNDSIMEAKYNSLKNVIHNIKYILNKQPSKEDSYE